MLDAAGNTLAQRGVTMTYNQANRLATVGSIGPLTYNADGQRTTKPAPSGTTVFHYGMDGLLLAETTDAGSLIRVYFWAEDTPIAQMDTELTYLHADHVDTPRIGTNNSGTIVWQWNSDGFGSLLPNEDPDGNGTATTVNLHFPGQYFDKETGLHYNYFRDYDPRIGRYLESDPIGLVGGLNTFGYVRQNPIRFHDFLGLVTEIIINNNTPIIGTHAGLVTGQGSKATLFDPGGSYRNLEKGSGGALYGKDVNLNDYIRYQKIDGPNVKIYRFQTTPDEEELIRDRIEKGGFNAPGSCAIDTSNALKGIGPFKNLGTHFLPSSLNKALNALEKAQ